MKKFLQPRSQETPPELDVKYSFHTSSVRTGEAHEEAPAGSG
jgi:hypothetical protein